jgi:hypothetical protein
VDDELAKVTHGQLRNAATRCPRRLQREQANDRGNPQPSARYRVSNQIVHDVRLAHVDCVRPDASRFRPTEDLRDEQRATYELFAGWYLALFGSDAVRVVDDPTSAWETPWPELGIRLVGGAALICEHDGGGQELRLLRFDNGPMHERPLDGTDVLFALLRARGVCSGPVSVSVGNLRTGQQAEEQVAFEEALVAAESWMGEQLAVVRTRMEQPEPVAGIECGSCAFIAGCGAHR